MNHSRRPFSLLVTKASRRGAVVALASTLLTACASSNPAGQAVITTNSRGVPGDVVSPTSPAGTPDIHSAAGSTSSSSGLGGGRGGF